MGELIEGAVQQAAQPGRHSMAAMLSPASRDLIAGRVSRLQNHQ
jgi:hypothetical protein